MPLLLSRTGRRRVSAWSAGALGLLLLVLALQASPAQATFAGVNGKIAFYIGQGSSDPTDKIWTIAPTGGTASALVDGSNPAWSPKGTHLAFARGGKIFVANADGSGVRALPDPDSEGASSPTWSPDGSKIAYTHVGHFVREIWIEGADGSNPTYVTDGWAQGASRPSWSPDGSKLAFELAGFQGNGTGLAVVDVEGTNLTELISPTDGAYDNTTPDWSPDGTKLAYASWGNPSAIDRIYVIGADGSNPTPLTNCTTGCFNSGDGDFDPSWSPDGTKIAFDRAYYGTDNATDLMVVDADGQNVQRLTGTTDWRKVLDAPAWRPIASPNEFGSIRVRLSSTPVTAGSSVTVTATALNGSGQRMTGYNATATWSDTSGDLSPATPASFVDGVSTTTATFPTPVHAGAMMVTSGGVTGLSDPFDVIGTFAAIRTTVPGSATASVPFTVQASATDSAGNTLIAYNAPATWSSLDGGLSPATPTNFVNGVSTTTATISQRFAADRITITSGGIGGQSNAFNVIGPTTIAVSVTTPVGVGTPFTVKAVARDPSGKTLTGFNAAASWSDLSGQLSPSAPLNFVYGVSTTQATVPIPFKGDKITVTSGGVSGTSLSFGVIGPYAGITTSVQKPVTAGSPFTFLAQAVDAVGNLVKSYNGPATWSDLSGHLSPATPASFANGISKTSATISSPFHADKITIASGGKSKQSVAFDVLGPLSSISVTVPSTVTHGVPFSVKAIARDAAGNTISTYNQTATWSSIGGGLSPAAPLAFKNGVSSTSATFANAYTSNRITVTSGGINGLSNLFNVL